MSDQFQSPVQATRSNGSSVPSAAPTNPAKAVEALESGTSGWRAMLGLNSPETTIIPTLRQLACDPQLHADVERLWLQRHGATLRASLSIALSGDDRDQALKLLPEMISEPSVQLADVRFPVDYSTESGERKERFAWSMRRLARHVLK